MLAVIVLGVAFVLTNWCQNPATIRQETPTPEIIVVTVTPALTAAPDTPTAIVALRASPRASEVPFRTALPSATATATAEPTLEPTSTPTVAPQRPMEQKG